MIDDDEYTRQLDELRRDHPEWFRIDVPLPGEPQPRVEMKRGIPWEGRVAIARIEVAWREARGDLESVVWHEQGEHPDGRVCTVKLRRQQLEGVELRKDVP